MQLDPREVQLRQAANLSPNLPPQKRLPPPPVASVQTMGGLKWRQLDGFLDQRYKFEKVLGKGAFGQVWLVSDRQTNKKFAVKELHSQIRQEDMDNIERELRVLIRATGGQQGPCHPNVVCYYDHFLARGGPKDQQQKLWIVMDYIPGQDLEETMKGKQPNPTEAYLIVESALKGLDFLHRQGIAHRDIKPANIRVRGAGGKTPQAVLVDLGLGCFDANECRFKAGTKLYMAPELFSNMQLNLTRQMKADIFSLGKTFYEYLNGVNHKQFDLSKPIYAQDSRIEKVVRSMLALNPDQRPNTSELLKLLRSNQGQGRPPLLQRTVAQKTDLSSQVSAERMQNENAPVQNLEAQERAAQLVNMNEQERAAQLVQQRLEAQRRFREQKQQAMQLQQQGNKRTPEETQEMFNRAIAAAKGDPQKQNILRAQAQRQWELDQVQHQNWMAMQQR